MTTQLTTPPAELATITTQTGLSAESAKLVVESFGGLYVHAKRLLAEAAGVEVKDETDVEGMNKARALRLKLRAVRCEAESTRKTLKEDSLRFGKAIDRVAHVVKDSIEPVEEELLALEQTRERLEAFRKAELKVAREAELVPLGVNPSLYQLGEMNEQEYASLLEASKKSHEERQRWAEEESRRRVAEEEARKAEEARIRAENERLLRQMQEQEAAAREEQEKARVEREKLEAAANAEREARRKAEAELRAKQEAEEKRKREEEEARARAARAPDREKLAMFAQSLRAITGPELSTTEANAILRNALGSVATAAAIVERWVRE